MWESEELKNAPTEKEKKEQKLKRKYSSKQLLVVYNEIYREYLTFFSVRSIFISPNVHQKP